MSRPLSSDTILFAARGSDRGQDTSRGKGIHMGKRPLLGMVGFFGLSLALSGCSDCGCFTRENGSPWKKNLSRNNQNDESWKDAPKSNSDVASKATADQNKFKSSTADTGNKAMNTSADAGNKFVEDTPPSAYRMPVTSGIQQTGGQYPTDATTSVTPTIVNNQAMRPSLDDGLKGGPAMPPPPSPLTREYPPDPRSNTTAAFAEPPVPSAPKANLNPIKPVTLPTLKGATQDKTTATTPPRQLPLADPSLADPPPPVPKSVKSSASLPSSAA